MGESSPRRNSPDSARSAIAGGLLGLERWNEALGVLEPNLEAAIRTDIDLPNLTVIRFRLAVALEALERDAEARLLYQQVEDDVTGMDNPWSRSVAAEVAKRLASEQPS